MQINDFSYELNLLKQGYKCIAGVDEVGRGPWAGPVMAAAAILNPKDLPLEANDSKKLTAKKRDELFEVIRQKAHVAIGEASVEEIDRLNIRQATFLAMNRAIQNLPMQPDFVAVDGRDVAAGLNIPAEAIIKGDGKVLSISCASIIAKVTRDRLMEELHQKYPHYGWNSNAGYGTKVHQEGLAQFGITSHHRRSFAPIKALL